MTLFSYCIPYDNGAAPNPFWGICTLAICKPVIRRAAKEGDWIIATGSKQFGFENQLIYAMKVTKTMSFEEYDTHCKTNLPNKIPDFQNEDPKRWIGDCIYEFNDPLKPLLRKSVHTEENRDRDLGGEKVLLSDYFYYFGSKPIPIPTHLLKIVRQGQGHKSRSNAPYTSEFLSWIESLSSLRSKVEAMPFGIKDVRKEECRARCSQVDFKLDEEDEIIGDKGC